MAVSVGSPRLARLFSADRATLDGYGVGIGGRDESLHRDSYTVRKNQEALGRTG